MGLAETDSRSFHEGKSWPQILAIVLACIPSFTCGLLFAWTSPSLLKIVNDPTYATTEEEASYLTVIAPITMIFASFVFPPMNDRFGRKKTILFMALPHLSSWLCICLAKSIYILYLSRIFSGIGDACLFASVPVYIGEISTPQVRGTWGNSMTFSFYFGQFMINVFGSYLSILVTAIVCSSFPIIFLIGFSFMPESPYFYLMKNRVDEARVSLQVLRRLDDVEEELTTLSSDVKRQMSERGTWKELFTVTSNRRAIYAAAFLRISQQFAGLSVFASYNQYIFTKSGGNLSPEVSSMIFASLAAFLNLCAASVLDKLGRKIATFYSLLLCSIVLFFESGYFYVNDFEPSMDLSKLNWIPITGIILYCIFYSFGTGIVPTLMLGELFSASIKGKALCVMNILFGILVSSITKLFHFMTSTFGLYSPFLFFAICCMVSCVMSLWLVPETKGKTLEEIQQSLKGTRKK